MSRFMFLLALTVWVQAGAAERSDPIQLDVDASEVPRRILHAQLRIPVSSGPLTLLYPKWIPGEHGPSGPITDVAGPKISAGNRTIHWRRDEVDMYVFHCEIPAGVDLAVVSLDFLLAPPSEAGAAWGVSATPNLAILNWNQLLLYPKGRPMREVSYRVRLILPPEWSLGTALPVRSRSGDETIFDPVSLETLIDSPLLCGRYFKEVKIGPPDAPDHYIEMAADSEAALEAPPEWKESCDRLVAEARALFGGWHYDSYHFLFALSDHISHFGLEHHESSDNRVAEAALIDDQLRLSWMGATLLPHEFAHVWNGKYRRPQDMVTEDFQAPQRTRELIVYEGLTHYLMMLLAARSGFRTPEQSRDFLAMVAEHERNQKGRTWRPLEDTAVAADLLFNARPDWASWRRGVDFYAEGLLIWLEVDAIIRDRTEGERSLDDFCRLFFGGGDGTPQVVPYTMDDLVATLNSIAEYDWMSLVETRMTATESDAPLSGIELGGWRLTYAEDPSEVLQAAEAADKSIDLSTSLGLLLAEDGSVVDVIRGKPADLAGIGPGMKVVAVDSRRWSAQLLRRAVAATRNRREPLELLMENSEFYRSHALDYHEGKKYPKLERDQSKEDLLAQILEPLTGR